ncbi:C2 domain-containing protein / GRAM domain-containing protein isoform 2 [Hibiscus syriacus]|uniref:C2 domain-containing protein / GRAM domain-containing protein isoform 2 n=1 Tax=Hibiscus syriacus TaxID=106335 RepID=A0A6A2XGL4_HIBSY|nr:C2 domain-containing protein / GRAM domain-containing protein isoform 2 [Hibiscus syriacus]
MKNFACDGLENLRILWELKERGLGGSVPTAICPNDVFQLPRKQSYMVRSMRMCRERAASALRASSSRRQAPTPPDKESKPKTEKIPFIKERVLVGIYNDVFPCTAKKLYNLLLSDDYNFTNEYRSSQKAKNLTMGQWHAAENVKVFETVQQAHDVPFGTYFEVSAHFKKRCVMQSKIKSGAVEEYKKEIETMLDVARSNIKSHIARGETDNSSSPPSVTNDIS